MHVIRDKIPTQSIAPDQLPDTITRTDTGAADPGCNPNHTDIEVIITTTPTEAVPGHITGRADTTIGVLHDTITPALTVITVTHHTTDHPHTGVLWHIQETTADSDHDLHIDQVRKHSTKLHLNITEFQQNLKIEGIPRVMIDDPQIDFYSSDYNSRNSDDGDNLK